MTMNTMKVIGHINPDLCRKIRQGFPFHGGKLVCTFSTSRSPLRSQVELDENERQVVLSLLNSLAVEDLRRVKGVSSTAAMNISRHRLDKGPFTKLEELLEVQNVGPKSFNALCNSLRAGKPVLAEEKQERSSFDRTFKLITPPVTKDFLKNVSEVTSLEFGSESVHYTSMTQDFSVTNWDHIPLMNTNYQKQTPVQIAEEAYRTVDLLPKSDLYLIESRMIRKLTPSYMQMLLFIKCLQTAVQILLNPNFAETNSHKVFYMKDSLTVKTFNLRVGSERVSGQQVLRQIEDNEYEDDVKIPSYLWKHFYSLRSDILQERYCNSLLIALAFCHHFRHELKSEIRLDAEQEELDDQLLNIS